MTDYTKLIEALRDIEKTMFALGTSPINMDNVSIRLAYDKRWGPTANDAADAIEALQAQLPKRGEWRLVTPDSYIFNGYRCSLCNELVYGMTNYCPNCGAKMEVKE